MTEQQLIFGLMSYCVFLFSTTCHEAAHAWVASLLGDDTARLGGQVTLDPTPHVKREPIGMIVVPLISLVMSGWMIGWASAPYNPHWASRWPKRCALMAMAGPAANFTLMLLSALLLKLGLTNGWFGGIADDGAEPFALKMLTLFFSMNLLLGVFNLIPFPPLDGASILYLVLPNSTSRKLMTLPGGFGLFGLIIAWQLFGVVYPPIRAFVTQLFFG